MRSAFHACVKAVQAEWSTNRRRHAHSPGAQKNERPAPFEAWALMAIPRRANHVEPLFEHDDRRPEQKLWLFSAMEGESLTGLGAAGIMRRGKGGRHQTLKGRMPCLTPSERKFIDWSHSAQTGQSGCFAEACLEGRELSRSSLS